MKEEEEVKGSSNNLMKVSSNLSDNKERMIG